jgi:hypothetical protein
MNGKLNRKPESQGGESAKIEKILGFSALD